MLRLLPGGVVYSGASYAGRPWRARACGLAAVTFRVFGSSDRVARPGRAGYGLVCGTCGLAALPGEPAGMVQPTLAVRHLVPEGEGTPGRDGWPGG